EVVPTAGLSTALWLEADRMKSLAVTQENFDNQRKVVQEEYRMRISNAAYAEGLVRLRELAYGSYWPYAHPTIGSMADLDAANIEWIREFHSDYYRPNNAVLAISGDLEPTQTLRWVEEYFGQAQAREVPAYHPPATVVPGAEREAIVEDANAQTPGLYLGWII